MKPSIQSQLLGLILCILSLCFRSLGYGSTLHRTKLWAWLWKQELRSIARDYGGKVQFWDNGTWKP